MSASDLENIKSLSQGKQRIVFVSGIFNVLHTGHLRLLKFAKDCGDFLVVGIYADAFGIALVDEQLRYESLKDLAFIDHLFILREKPEAFIKKLKPPIVVKGKEWETLKNPEAEACRSYDGKLVFSSGESTLISNELLLGELRKDAQKKLPIIHDYPYLNRHDIGKKQLLATVDRFQGMKVGVVGDTIVDEYINCDAIGMSQEDPTIVLSPVQEDRFIGGAGIVAAHAQSLGAEIQFFSVSGKDALAGWAREKLQSYHVRHKIIEDDSRPTTLKQRLRAAGKTLLRVNRLKQHELSPELATRLKDLVAEALPQLDLLILSDFNYGCLPQSLVDFFAESCAQHRVMVVADSQSSSQIGDISRFKNMDLITPTEREARLAMRDFSSGLVTLAEALRKRSRSKNLMVTLGSEGLFIHTPESKKRAVFTDRLPAMNRSPRDVSGAGDCLLTTTALALKTGADIWQAAYLGALAAALQVSQVGNNPLSTESFRTLIEEIDEDSRLRSRHA